MNVVGFIMEHDSNLECAKELSDMRTGEPLSDDILDKLIVYMRQGIQMMKTISTRYDTDGEDTRARSYMSDGEWIWPEYYAFYLKKYPGIQVPQAFLDHVLSKEGVMKPLSDHEGLYANYMLLILLKIKIPHKSPNLKLIQYLIAERGEELIYY